MITKLSCEEFVEQLASSKPVPGGGGAAALVGAIGAALAGMVASLTMGKPRYAAVEADIQRLSAECAVLQQRLLLLVQQDADVFEPLSRAYGLPTATPEQKQEKAAQLEEALRLACSAPLEIMRTVAAALPLIAELAEKGSRLAVSDAGCAAACCEAALQAASLNVQINTKAMADRAYAEQANKESHLLLQENLPLARQIFCLVADGLAN